MDESAPWRALEPSAVDDRAPANSASREGSARYLALAAGAGLALGLLALVAVMALRSGGRVDVAIQDGTGGSGVVQPSPSPQMLVVQVSGAVTHPGVYSLPAGSRVADAIDAAGGYSADVDPRLAEKQLNLAARLVDAQVVMVPRRGDGMTVAESSAAGLVNLNTASAAELDTLPGVGPATASRIIAAREEKAFGSVEDLVSRKVVTAATLAKFRDQVTV
jgi:competence protein ComEA